MNDTGAEYTLREKSPSLQFLGSCFRFKTVFFLSEKKKCANAVTLQYMLILGLFCISTLKIRQVLQLVSTNCCLSEERCKKNSVCFVKNATTLTQLADIFLASKILT